MTITVSDKGIVRGEVTSMERTILRVTLDAIINPSLLPGEDRIAVISDVHLGHRRVPTEKIIATLDALFPPQRMEYLSFIIITGDLFDRRLSFDSHEAWLCSQWIKRLLRLAKTYDVGIRVLNGTPNHDEGQGKWLPRLNEISGIDADVRYYDKITIDTLYEGGPTCLWIPDEMNHDATVTWKQVNEVLREKGLDKVDFAFMHGMFTYQEPIRTVVSHLEERYFSIVNHKIVIGHHHTHTTNNIIVVPSSLERLRMNEEEEKGHYQFSFSQAAGVYDEYFIVNETATLFTTFDVEGWPHKKVVDLLKSLKDSPSDSWFRFRMSRDDESFPSFKQLEKQFSPFKLSIKQIETEGQITDTEELIDRPVMTSIRPDTLKDLIEPRLKGVDPAVRKIIDKILEAC